MYVKMKDLKTLIRTRVIDLDWISEDGSYVRFMVSPKGPTIKMSIPTGPLLVVDGETVQKSMVESFPQLFEGVDVDG